MKIEAKQTQIGPSGRKVWFAYVDGGMLRGKNGVGRAFRSEAAAINAAKNAAFAAFAKGA